MHLRSYFEQWRKESHKKSTGENVDEEGPIVEECLDEKIKCQNLIQFAKD